MELAACLPELWCPWLGGDQAWDGPLLIDMSMLHRNGLASLWARGVRHMLAPSVLVSWRVTEWVSTPQVRGLDGRRPGFLLQPDDAAVRLGEARGPEEPRGPQKDHRGPSPQAQAGGLSK